MDEIFKNRGRDIIDSSKEIIQKAIVDFKPKAIVIMLSGGDDSMTAYHIARILDIKYDFVIHGVTGTGVEETQRFVEKTVSKNKDRLILADAGSTYVDYVLRKGFWGYGLNAHALSYQSLKATPFRKVMSKFLRQNRRNYPILLINGARRLESENRKKTMLNPYRRDPAALNNIWVNIINEWTHHECIDQLEGDSIDRNPVSKLVCRSAECYCGTLQTEGDYTETGYYFPNWKKKMDGIRRAVKKKGFPWDWGQPIPNNWTLEKNGQGNLFTGFQPMCKGCKVNFQSDGINE